MTITGASGSPCEDYSAIDCPVYVVGGWADPYRQAVLDLLEWLDCPRKGLIGPWAHQYPEEGTPGPAIDFRAECVRWWDQWLKGDDTGVLADPDLRVWMQEGVSARRTRRSLPGTVGGRGGLALPARTDARIFPGSGQAHRAWGAPGVRWPFAAPASGFGPAPGARGGSRSFRGIRSGEDDLSLCFTSAPLEERIEILGSPRPRSS